MIPRCPQGCSKQGKGNLSDLATVDRSPSGRSFLRDPRRPPWRRAPVVALVAIGLTYPLMTIVTGAPVASASSRGVVGAARLTGWQTNGIVWAIAAAKGKVYIGGDFTSLRREGAPAGSGEVAREHLAAFDATTGKLLPFHHHLDGQVAALAASPHGDKIYLGGRFTHVDGRSRGHVAAFYTHSGALRKAWKPRVSANVSAIAAHGNTVYLGGAFSSVNGEARERLAATSASGTLLAWHPRVDGGVTAMALPKDGSRVIIGGYFDVLNGSPHHAIGSVYPAHTAKSGRTAPWQAQGVVPSCSVVKDIVAGRTKAYAGAEGTGVGCFDGTFAVRASNGALDWKDNCLGATQALALLGPNLYVGSHAHNCSTVPGGFPESELPPQRLMAESRANGSIQKWWPNTSGNPLGPRSLGTDGRRLYVGGDFLMVNHTAQQGFARFGTNAAPGTPGKPTSSSNQPGHVRLSWEAVVDRDDGTLTYRIYRDGGQSPIGWARATSDPWDRPTLTFEDTGVSPGTHRYRVAAFDGTVAGNESPQSDPVTVH
jgi:hypothetical protein